jgi:hypothetical protein
LLTGNLSERQVAAVITINEKLSDGKISRKAAMKLLASTLGVSPEVAAEFIEADSEQVHLKDRAQKKPAGAEGVDADVADKEVEPPAR